MKTHLLALGLAVLGAARAISAPADTTASTIDQQVTQAVASQDARQVMASLPAIEKLWPRQPNDYFESVKKTAGAVDAAFTDAPGRSVISNLFASLIVKAAPATPAAVPLLEAKKDAILYFFNFREVREDKTNLLALAQYVGRLRDQMIPNFVPKMTYINPPGLMGATPAQAQQILAENERNKALNYWQQTLQLENTILTFQLTMNAGRLSARHPEDSGFSEAIAKAAREQPAF